jgi:hypothetical protein
VHSPDPALSVSCYADGILDAAVREGVSPLLQALQARNDAPWSLWFIRYSRGGEHLKLRLHGPTDEVSSICALVSETVGVWLRTVPVAAASGARRSRPDAPAIDPEDETECEYPDRTLIWTRYRRSTVSLGPAPLLEDDDYTSHLVASLAAGAEIAVCALEGPEPVTSGARQRPLLRALAEGLGALPLSADRRSEYLAYHRDWLLRFLAGGADEVEAGRGALEAESDRMGAAVVQLSGALQSAWTAGAPPPPAASFAASLVALHGTLERFRGDAAYDVDPFARGPLFPALFKAFHGLANQLGIAAREEAFVHHLCLRAALHGAPTPAEA